MKLDCNTRLIWEDIFKTIKQNQLAKFHFFPISPYKKNPNISSDHVCTLQVFCTFFLCVPILDVEIGSVKFWVQLGVTSFVTLSCTICACCSTNVSSPICGKAGTRINVRSTRTYSTNLYILSVKRFDETTNESRIKAEWRHEQLRLQKIRTVTGTNSGEWLELENQLGYTECAVIEMNTNLYS